MDLPPYWLPRPSMSLSAEVRTQLEALFEGRIRTGDGGWIEDTLPTPLWQLLCWLADERGVLLHGTGDPGIEQFEPRQSNDVAEFGNRNAIYAASDGIWPMFFAVVDRVRYKMTIVNAAIRLETPDDAAGTSFYFFSMTDRVLAQAPWRAGVVYVLPPATFEEEAGYRIDGHRVHTNHWASREPVRPLAKFRVRPDDFPFLRQIRAQNDDLLAARAEANPGGFPWLD